MALRAQSTLTPPALGLLRLKGAVKVGDGAPLVAGKFTVDELSATGVAGVAKGKKNSVDYLALDVDKAWSRPIRGGVKEVTFVSFQVYASAGTIVDIGGARLGVVASPVAGGLQLMFDDEAAGSLQWKSLNCHVATGRYDGRNFAALPTLTVRLDPGAGTWDLFSGGRLLADNLPLIAARKNDRTFDLRAGAEGAWVTGLVLADENPLYQDANNNGIDDAFEKQKRGGTLLPDDASIADRQLLAKQWRDAQRAKPPQPLVLSRPSPDR